MPPPKRPVILVIVTILALISLAAVLSFLLVRERHISNLCFALDIVPHRVPHSVPLIEKGAAIPFAFGTICFDQMQNLVSWTLDDKYQYIYGGDGERMRDMTLQGPIAANSSVGGVVLQMGLNHNSARQLSGSSVLELSQIGKIWSAPQQYYVALFASNQHATALLEVGRSPLFVSTKKDRKR